MNENPPPPVETPGVPPGGHPDPIPAAPAPPPAAALVVNGVVKSEREIELEGRVAAAESRARKAEFDAAEKERLAQELIAQTKAAPAVAPKPPKPRRFGPIPIFTSDDD